MFNRVWHGYMVQRVGSRNGVDWIHAEKTIARNRVPVVELSPLMRVVISSPVYSRIPVGHLTKVKRHGSWEWVKHLQAVIRSTTGTAYGKPYRVRYIREIKGNGYTYRNYAERVQRGCRHMKGFTIWSSGLYPL